MPVIPAIYSRTELSFFGDCPPFYLHTNAEVGAGFIVWECRQGGGHSQELLQRHAQRQEERWCLCPLLLCIKREQEVGSNLVKSSKEYQ